MKKKNRDRLKDEEKYRDRLKDEEKQRQAKR